MAWYHTCHVYKWRLVVNLLLWLQQQRTQIHKD